MINPTNISPADGNADRRLEDDQLEATNGGGNLNALLHPIDTWNKVIVKPFKAIGEVFSKFNTGTHYDD